MSFFKNLDYNTLCTILLYINKNSDTEKKLLNLNIENINNIILNDEYINKKRDFEPVKFNLNLNFNNHPVKELLWYKLFLNNKC